MKETRAHLFPTLHDLTGMITKMFAGALIDRILS